MNCNTPEIEITLESNSEQASPWVERPRGYPPLDPVRFNLEGRNENDQLGSLPFASLYNARVSFLGKIPMTLTRSNPQTKYTIIDQATMMKIRRQDDYLSILNIQIPQDAYEIHYLEGDGKTTTTLKTTERVYIPVTLTDGRICFLLVLVVMDPLGRKVSLLGTDNDQVYIKII